MEQGKTTLNVSPLLGISEPSLLLESVDQRIAWLWHQLEVGASTGWPGHSAAAIVYHKTVLDSLVRQRDEMTAVFSKLLAFQKPNEVVVIRQEDAQ